MAAKWSAIPSNEVHNTRREWFDGDGRFFASVTLQCEWVDRFKLVEDLYTSQYGATDPVVANGYNPRVYPDPGGSSGLPTPFPQPDMSQIGVTSATFRSWKECGGTLDANEQVFDYKSSAFVEVQYGRHYNIQETLEFDVEVITQSYLDFRWKTPQYAGDLGLVKELEVPIATLYSAVLTRDFIGLAPGDIDDAALTPNLATLVDSVGHTNVREYKSEQLGITFKEGTLLMLEPVVRPSINMQHIDTTIPATNLFGENGFAVTVKFLYKKGGDEQLGEDVNTHNLFWRPAKTYGQNPNTFHGAWDRLLVPTPGENQPWEEYRPFKPSLSIDSHWLWSANKPLSVL
jgi:hypothetical protein